MEQMGRGIDKVGTLSGADLFSLWGLELIGAVDQEIFVTVAGERINHCAAGIALVQVIKQIQVLFKIQLLVQQQLQLFKVTHKAPAEVQMRCPQC